MSRTPEGDNPYSISEDDAMYDTKPHSSARKAHMPNIPTEPETRIQRASRNTPTNSGTKPPLPLSTRHPARSLKQGEAVQPQQLSEQTVNSGRTYRSTLDPIKPQRASLLSPDSQRGRFKKKSSRRKFLIGGVALTLMALTGSTILKNLSSSGLQQAPGSSYIPPYDGETATVQPKFVETKAFPEPGEIWESEIFYDAVGNRMKVLRFTIRSTDVPIIAVKPNTHTTQLGFIGETEQIVNGIVTTYGEAINNSDGWPKPVQDVGTGTTKYPAQIIDISNPLGKTAFARYFVKGTRTEDPQFEAAIATRLDQVESDITNIQKQPGLNVLPTPFALTFNNPAGVNEIPVYTEVTNPLG